MTASSFAFAAFDDRWRAAQAHQPYFCEENVWQLLRAAELPVPRAALFVTNRARTVAMWGQRAASRDPVFWDYHVVVLLPQHGVVVDLDDRQCMAWPVGEWLRRAFRSQHAHEQPWFRIVPEAAFLTLFSSDRSHMRDAGGAPLRPFPPWPAPFQPERGHTLPRFLDLDCDIAGVVTDAAGLVRAMPDRGS